MRADISSLPLMNNRVPRLYGFLDLPLLGPKSLGGQALAALTGEGG